MFRKLPHWINKTQHPKSVHLRELLRDYVLIMANTGMRHGTEAQNLKWQHITQFEDNGQSYLEMNVSGKTGQARTLYSVRHKYATFALLNDGMDIHTLAIQMGTSIQMIERHYSHLTPRLRKDMLTGKRYELSKKEYFLPSNLLMTDSYLGLFYKHFLLTSS